MAVAEASPAEPLKKAGVTERLVARLLGMVTTGNLQPGDQLPSERKLAESYGVSRPTVREAIRALSVLGVLDVRHGGGIFVSALSAADILNPLSFFLTLRASELDKLYDARQLIEGDIAARAARGASPEDIRYLDELIAEQEKAVGNPALYRDLDSAFHGRLAALADNEFLLRTAQSLNVLGMEFRKIASETPSVIAISIADHRLIVEALRTGEPEAARRAMAGHMDHVLQTTRAALQGDKRHG